MTDSLRARREALLAEPGLTGVAWCRRYAAACDTWLAERFAAAVAGDADGGRGVALVAVGGYGSGEMAPGSDLDLVLVHERRAPPKAIADALWYPIWDEGMALDHSVRTLKELRSAMGDDPKVALGWLQARVVAGDAELGAESLERSLSLWRGRAERWLPEVAAAVAARHDAHGDLAFLLEPDLKEARGGTRDLRVLQAVARVAPGLDMSLEGAALVGAADVLAAARVELQRSTGKPSSRLLLQDQDVVAAALGYPDADLLMADVAGAARTIAWVSDDGWRRITKTLSRRRGRRRGDRPLEHGIAARDGEVALTANADPAGDPTLALRLAAVSAELDLPMAATALDRLRADARFPAGTWPAPLRAALVRLLATGRPGLHAVEALDQAGVWVRLLPEWGPVRNRPQRNAYHRFTVDRHLLEVAAGAARHLGRVTRPDLLLVGALLHDIGKGRGGDHTEVGIGIVEALAPRMGFDAGDTATLVTLVRHHLLLADAATRRDLDDPRTVALVADAVGDAATLELLAALTEADSLATGPSAWGAWKASLVDTLVARTRAHLDGVPARPGDRSLSAAEQALVDAGELALVADGSRVTVAAPDRPGLLATVAGVLALSGCTVRSAWTRTEQGAHMAVLVFEVAPTFDTLPAWPRVRHDLAAALDGRLALGRRLEEREATYGGRGRPTAAAPPPIAVVTDNAAATAATVVEVRCPDAGPVLHRVASALTDAGVVINAALVSTVGAEAVDAFYVTSADGAKLDDDTAAAVVAAVRAALDPPAAPPPALTGPR
ncbi:MAG TPA: [protein-PII] uridylyltransferase [Acidimicrobiales bacterium]|nr:[protein-PII] uridylyltransferase [Acidimicrobiales bacterium]